MRKDKKADRNLNMPLPETKKELLKRLNEACNKLEMEYAEIEEKASREKRIEGEGSPADLLAYQIEWGRLLLSWEEAEQKGKTLEMPAKGYKWNELGQLAESFYNKHNKTGMHELLVEYGRIVGSIKAMIQGLDENELFEIGKRKWAGDKWPIVKWIQVNTIAPYRSARTKIRRWKKAKK